MNEHEFCELIADALIDTDEERETEEQVLAGPPASFEERGILTRNNGLVVRLIDGSEFQVTIVQSAEADEPAVCELCGEESTPGNPVDTTGGTRAHRFPTAECNNTEGCEFCGNPATEASPIVDMAIDGGNEGPVNMARCHRVCGAAAVRDMVR